uniref:Uncharacterized protein n=1 Tax=Tanacetum cinerariifolium TaxID=118510 RepID=A0A6L2N8E8_TANCI|nr:hypothetical protein [Tanacetum cinerariifolium]
MLILYRELIFLMLTLSDETIYEKRRDRVERVATTAASLDAEQDMENTKTAQDLEITHLKNRVKRLEKKRKLRTPQLKRRYGHDTKVNTASTSITTTSINITTTEPVTTVSAPITTAGVSVSTVEPITPATTTTTTIIEDKDLTIAHTLMKIRSEKAIEKAKERGSKEKSTETATRPAKGVIIRESKEQRELTIKERSKLFVELMNERKKAFCLRVEEKRRRSPTKAQKRNQICTYLKNIAGFTHNQLKNKSFKEVQKAFYNTISWINSFVPMDKEVTEGSKARAEGTSKRAEELESDKSKKQKLDEKVEAKEDNDQEEAEMKMYMKIVPNDEIAIDAIPLATKPPIIVDWKIIKEEKITKYVNTKLEEAYERVLWGDLKVLFKPDLESEVWRKLQGNKVTVWKLFSSCGVHFAIGVVRDLGFSCDLVHHSRLWEEMMMKPDHQDPNALDSTKSWKRYCFHEFIMNSYYRKVAAKRQSLEIDEMLRIKLCEVGSNEEMFTSVTWIRAFNINELIYLELCHEFYSTYEFDEVCDDDELQTKKINKFRLSGRAHSFTLLEFARRLGLYHADELNEEGFDVYFQGGLRSDEHFNAQEYWLSISREDNLSYLGTSKRVCECGLVDCKVDEKERRWYSKGESDLQWKVYQKLAKKARVSSDELIRSLSALIYYRNLDTTTLRELIDSEGRLIPEDPQQGVPRVAIPRPPRASMQDLYERMVFHYREPITHLDMLSRSMISIISSTHPSHHSISSSSSKMISSVGITQEKKKEKRRARDKMA